MFGGVGRVVEAEQVANLVERDRVDRLRVEQLAGVVVQRERDVRGDDPPASSRAPRRSCR